MLRSLFTGLLFVLSCDFATAQGKVYIDVGDAKVRKSLLALPNFQYTGSNKSSDNLSDVQDLFNVIRADLETTGLFTMIKPEAFLEDTDTVGLKPAPGEPNGFNFNNWKTIGTEFLIRGGAQKDGANLTLEVYAYYVPQGKLVLGKRYSGPTSHLRKLGHTFANDLVKELTGKESFLLHRIVATVDKGPRTHREIFTMDWDSHNKKQISKHNSIAISPAWSPNGKYIAYTAFITRKIGSGPKKKNPDMFVYEVDSGKRWLVSYRDGMNSGAEFFPDNQHLLVTLTEGPGANIYKIDRSGKNKTRITSGTGRAMNVEPAISPDGRKIAFSSDRSGKPMIYVMNVDGSGVRRLTFAGHYNSTPSWSPDGKKLAFAGFDRNKNNFDIFLVNVDGTGLERLTSAKKANGKWSNNEEPSFSPDGRHVMFISDRTGPRQIYMVNSDGSNERRITYDDLYYAKPKWGPKQD